MAKIVVCLGLLLLVVPAFCGVNQVVESAPAAELINGNDDIDPNGNCKTEILALCEDVTAGEGALADCVSDQISESEYDGTIVITKACKEEVYQYKISRDSNINKNVPLARACKTDVDKFCNSSWFFGYQSGQIIACLREVKDQTSPGCQKQITKIQMDAAMDYRADPELYEACKDDAETTCKDVEIGEGRVQACLRDNRVKLSWMCVEQLFRQERENADDIRLSVRLFKKCLPDKKKFCEDIPPGNSAAKDCLEMHRNDEGFSEECKEELEAVVERRVSDFRLDPRLARYCEADLLHICSYLEDMDDYGGYSNSLHYLQANCLQDYVNEIQDPSCKAQVKKYQELASENIRFDSMLAEACIDDRRKLCTNVQPGSARVIRCLQNQHDKLSTTCRAVLFDEEVRFSSNIDFQYPMKIACEGELGVFCKDVPHGEERAIRCLQDHKDEPAMGQACKDELVKYEQHSAVDYRLNHRLSTLCSNDITNLCSKSCNASAGQYCGGTVLRCLTDNKENIENDGCKAEVTYFEKMEVNDYRNDVILAAACRNDVQKFCAKIEPGEGRVHQCLRDHHKEISEQCRKEELLLEEVEAESIELRPGLLRACKDERKLYCNDVAAGAARVFRCLAENMGDADFGETCKAEVMTKLRRRQSNWKLDPALRKACKDDVRDNCITEDKSEAETGSVYHCLVGTRDSLSQTCQRELGRAVHMAFFVWEPEAPMTSICDDSIKDACLSERPNMANTPGEVARCMVDLLARPGPSKRKSMISEECAAVVVVAEPPDMQRAFDASLTLAAVVTDPLSGLQSATGVRMIKYDQNGNVRGITLSGWTALLGIVSMVVLMTYGAWYGYRRYRGIDDKAAYTVVLKGKQEESRSLLFGR